MGDLVNAAIEWKCRALDAEAALERVKALHAKRRAYADDWDTCTCGYDEYPCPTIRALETGTGNESMTEAQREAKDQYLKRRAAEDAIERVREAATEVTNQGDNHGRTHYEGCWQHHLHCLAAKIIYETAADDATQS